MQESPLMTPDDRLDAPATTHRRIPRELTLDGTAAFLSNIGHRCPGEAITGEVMKGFLASLLSDIEYEVPPQDLRITRARMPALPRDRFVIENVHTRRPPSEALTANR